MDQLSKNARVLKFLAGRCGGLFTTRLLKLVYLSDVLSLQWRGAQVTDLEYSWYTYGPFDAAFYRGVEELEAVGLLAREEVTFPDGYRGNKISSVGGMPVLNLDPDEEQILTWVAEEYKNEPLDDLLSKIVYETEPMKKATEGRKLPMQDLANAERIQSGFEFARLVEGERQAALGLTVDADAFFERLLTKAD